ncbi:unnamed protein product, partial [Closterium sp. NIES-53]
MQSCISLSLSSLFHPPLLTPPHLYASGSMRPFCRGLPESPLLTCLRASLSAAVPCTEKASVAADRQQQGRQGAACAEERVSGAAGGSGEASGSGAHSSISSGSGQMYLE